jgi:uncharacterized protein YdhG (YjbR/CyaY superfamily)
MKKGLSKPETIDQYLAGIPRDKRDALEHLRKTIRKIIPQAQECISYQLPAFRMDGRVLVWFGAAANHCSFYPGGVIDAFKADLKEYETSKGTIRFQPDHPLPSALVRKLVTSRIARTARPQGVAAAAGRRRRPAGRNVRSKAR